MINVISDVKGTLTYFAPQITAEVNYFLAQLELIGVDENAREGLRLYLSDKTPRKVTAPIINAVAKQGYENGSLNLSDFLRAGVPGFFEHVKADGGRIILVGLAQPETTRASLRTASLDRYVDRVYQSTEVGSKEDGTAFRTIAERERLDLSQCVYLDDKEEQILGAKKAGIGGTVLVTDQPEKRDGLITFTDFQDVLRLYKEFKKE